MKARRVILTLVLLILVSCFSGACSGDRIGPTKTIEARDGVLQCQVPERWKEVSGELNQMASLEAADGDAEQYMIAVSELKDDFDADLGLTGYNKIMVGNVKGMLKDENVISEESLKVGGREAILTKIEGMSDNVNITYWVCAIDFPEHFTMATTWTLSDNADSSEKLFLFIIESIKETGSPESNGIVDSAAPGSADESGQAEE